MGTTDPYRTAELRRRVLAAWTESAARFREDANAEEELARGAYRDRVIVELAQNAADAAALAGVGGRLLLRFDGSALVAANTGTPLDGTGVEALSTLRASAKPDDTPGVVGRFGVGFAAVLAVTDAPAVASHDGAVRWSRDDAAAVVSERPGLAAQLAARESAAARTADSAAPAAAPHAHGRAVPVLRLPFPAAVDPPEGYDTAVHLPMRDAAAGAHVAALLDEVDDALLLALPGLTEIVIERDDVTRRLVTTADPVGTGADRAHESVAAVRTVVCTTSVEDAAGAWESATSWRLASAAGAVPGELLAERPAEERGGWSVTVAAPCDDDGGPTSLPDGMRRAIRAPTPTEDGSDLPALVLASWPLDSSRRHVQPGALTDFLAGKVAGAYATLVADLASGPEVLRLVPGPMAAGAVDATLHRAITAELAETPFVPPATPVIIDTFGAGYAESVNDHGEGLARLRPDSAVVIDGAAGAADPAALAAVVPGMADPRWWRPGALDRLGARRMALADVIDALAGVTAEPHQWRDLYDALQGADLGDLSTMPVPLADGRTVRGARGALLPVTGATPAALDALGLRVVHPDAAHPLLTRLGAREAEPAAVLTDPAVRDAVERLADEASGETDADAAAQVAEAVLDLVASSGVSTADEPWLGRLLLTDGTGERAEAGELWLPGSPVVPWLDAEPAECCVSDDLLARHGRAVLEAVGVQRGFSVTRVGDVPLEHAASDLPDFEAWVDAAHAELGDPDAPPILAELTAIQDLDLVRDDAWPAVLNALAGDQATQAVLTEPALAVLDDGTRASVPSYTSWWIRTHVRVDDRPVGELCAPDAEPVVRTVLPPAPAELSEAAASALGLVRSIGDLVAAPELLLDRLADPKVRLGEADMTRIYRALAEADPDVPPPDRVRVVGADGDTYVTGADSVVVISSPQWLQLGLPAVIPGPPALADVLDVDLAEQRHASVPDSEGVTAPVPEVVRRVLADAVDTYVEHDDLRVGGRQVSWWVESSGTVHAATSDGLARALAWACGRWDVRLLLAEALRDPDVVDMLVAEHRFSARPGQL